jgi:multicomponent Na+:H+ antiporter subunit D
MNALLIAPVALPLLGAAVCLLFWRRVVPQQAIAVATSASLLVVSIVLLLRVSESGIQVTEVGGWEAPLGIVLVADLFSAMMVCVTGIIGLATVVYSLGTISRSQAAEGYFPLLLVLLGGVCGAFLTGDLFNLYVWFEVMLMSSFVLLALGGSRLEMEGALKYVALNIFASLVFLSALGLLYSTTGTLNFAGLSLAIQNGENAGLITTLGIFFLVSFGIKSALFPFFFWLPSSYHTPPVAVSALFAGLLTKVGVYALIRVYSLLFVQDVGFTHTLILVISGATMVTGVLGAMSQNEVRRILSFHIISQIGYMTMGLGLFTLLGVSGGIFYIVHHIIVKTNLFFVSGVMYHLRGTFELKVLGGLQARPVLAVLFLVPALSLAGMPPFSGFFAKLSLIQAGLADGEYIIVAVSIFVGFLTLYSMSKIWNEAFLKPQPEPAIERSNRLEPLQVLPIAVLAGLTVAIGLGAGPLLDLANRAAEQLLDQSDYVTAVLGEEGETR